MGILQYDTQRLPQIRFFDLVDIDAVITDLTILNIIETVDQVRDRSLAGTGGAYKCNLLTGLCIHLDVMQHDLVIIVAEVHIIEYYFTL